MKNTKEFLKIELKEKIKIKKYEKSCLVQIKKIEKIPIYYKKWSF